MEVAFGKDWLGRRLIRHIDLQRCAWPLRKQACSHSVLDGSRSGGMLIFGGTELVREVGDVVYQVPVSSVCPCLVSGQKIEPSNPDNKKPARGGFFTHVQTASTVRRRLNRCYLAISALPAAPPMPAPRVPLPPNLLPINEPPAEPRPPPSAALTL